MRVMLVCPNTYGYPYAIRDGLKKSGATVHVLTYCYWASEIWQERLARRFGMYCYGYEYERTYVQRFQRRLVRFARRLHPDILLVVKGELLTSETLRAVRAASRGIRIGAWLYDSIVRYPAMADVAAAADRAFCFEPTDVPPLQDMGANATYLPQAFDPRHYQPGCDRFYPLLDRSLVADLPDVFFVGNCKPEYESRVEMLGRVAEGLGTGIQCGFYGPWWTRSDPDYPHRIGECPALLAAVRDRLLNHRQLNLAYHRVPICLNLHHPQSREGLNPRTFEIAGAGGFQLVDAKPRLAESIALGQEVETFRSIEEATDKIRFYMQRPEARQTLATRASVRAHRDHTYAQRMHEILRALEK